MFQDVELECWHPLISADNKKTITKISILLVSQCDTKKTKTPLECQNGDVTIQKQPKHWQNTKMVAKWLWIYVMQLIIMICMVTSVVKLIDGFVWYLTFCSFFVFIFVARSFLALSDILAPFGLPLNFFVIPSKYESSMIFILILKPVSCDFSSYPHQLLGNFDDHYQNLNDHHHDPHRQNLNGYVSSFFYFLLFFLKKPYLHRYLHCFGTSKMFLFIGSIRSKFFFANSLSSGVEFWM